MSLTDKSKAISVVWEFTGVGIPITRFVFNDHSGLDHTEATNVFFGAEPRNEVAPQFDVLSGKLTTGKFDFSCVDKDQLLTQWLSDFDGGISKCNVRRLTGLIGDVEATYAETFWKLEDYKVATKSGGSYQFSCQNILKQMSVSIHNDIDGQGALNADITISQTTITLEDVPSSSWPTGDVTFALLYDTGTRECELITYDGISGAVLQNVVRSKFGVGGVGSDGRVFLVDTCEIYHVWVKRGNPIDVMLELMFSSDAKVEQGCAAIDGGLENWTADVPDDWDSTSPGGGNDLTEETGTVHGGSSAARFTYSGSGTRATVSCTLAASEIERDHYLKISWWLNHLSGIAGTKNMTMSVFSSAGYYYSGVSGEWQVAFVVAQSQVESGTTYIEKKVNIKMESRFVPLDATVLITWRMESGTGAMGLDDISLVGWYTNMDYDVGDGVDIQGAGLLEHMVNVTEIETVRDLDWSQPTFDGNDEVLTGGTAILFVETKPIDDLKKFIEQHILRPFGIKPLVDVEEKFTIGKYFDVSQAPIVVGDKWAKSKFSASGWKRNYSKKVNNIRMLTDWDPVKGEHNVGESRTHASSVKKYGEAKALELPGRGMRTGEKGFLDYGNRAEMLTGIGLIFLETANPFSHIQVETFYEFRDASQKDNIQINVPLIPDLTQRKRGIEDGSFFLDKKIIDNQQGRIKMTLRQRRPVSRPAFIAPNSFATNYTSASTAERDTGCYLTPNGGGQFSNGDEGYTVVGST